MEVTMFDNARRGYTLIKLLEIITLSFLMLVSIADATPCAHIYNFSDDDVCLIDTTTNTSIASENIEKMPMEAVIDTRESTVVEVTQLDQINTSLKKKCPVLLSIGSELCSSCQKIKPILQNLSTEYTGKATIMHIDADKSPDIVRYLENYSTTYWIPDSRVIVGIKKGQYVYIQNNGETTTDIDKARFVGYNVATGPNQRTFEEVINLALLPKVGFGIKRLPISPQGAIRYQFFTLYINSECLPITNYYWDFGDGTYSTLKNPYHTFYSNSPKREYIVTLTVTNQVGNNTGGTVIKV